MNNNGTKLTDEELSCVFRLYGGVMTYQNKEAVKKIANFVYEVAEAKTKEKMKAKCNNK